jgi:uncharacterized protein YraI
MSARILIHVILSGLLSVSMAAAARAEVAPGIYAIASDASGGILNMRSGPGQGHGLVVSIPAGASGVVIGECRRADDRRSRYDWCRATWKGHSGWVSSCCIMRSSSQTAAGELSRAQYLRSIKSCPQMRGICHARLCKRIQERAFKVEGKVAVLRDRHPGRSYELLEESAHQLKNTYRLCEDICSRRECDGERGLLAFFRDASFDLTMSIGSNCADCAPQPGGLDDPLPEEVLERDMRE